MKILVVGAGIAGSTFAAFAKKYNLAEVTLVDHAPEFRTIGYLIELWGNGRKILEKLGIDTSVVRTCGFEYTRETIYDKRGVLLKSFSLDSFGDSLPTVAIRRSDLHAGLVGLLDGITIRFGTTVTGIVQENKVVRVTFSDGAHDTFDLVIGADGTRSFVREYVFGKSFLTNFGWGVWMYWLPETFARGSDAIGYIGDGKICAVLPHRGAAMGTLVAKVPLGQGKDLENRRKQLHGLFSDFCDAARVVVEASPDATDIYYDDVAHVDMPLWHRGRVVLTGDAQHAISPIAGMGTSMALEDAYVLAEELKNGNDIDASLVRYARRREARMKKLRRSSQRMDRWVMANGLLGKIRDLAVPFVPVSYFIDAVKEFVHIGA